MKRAIDDRSVLTLKIVVALSLPFPNAFDLSPRLAETPVDWSHVGLAEDRVKNEAGCCADRSFSSIESLPHQSLTYQRSEHDASSVAARHSSFNQQMNQPQPASLVLLP